MCPAQGEVDSQAGRQAVRQAGRQSVPGMLAGRYVWWKVRRISGARQYRVGPEVFPIAFFLFACAHGVHGHAFITLGAVNV